MTDLSNDFVFQVSREKYTHLEGTKKVSSAKGIDGTQITVFTEMTALFFLNRDIVAGQSLSRHPKNEVGKNWLNYTHTLHTSLKNCFERLQLFLSAFFFRT